MCEKAPTLFRRLILRTAPESSKRAMAIWATWTLAMCALGIGGSITYAIAISEKHDVGSGAVAAFAAVTVPPAGLAGFNYRKADEAKQGAENEGGKP